MKLTPIFIKCLFYNIDKQFMKKKLTEIHIPADPDTRGNRAEFWHQRPGPTSGL